VILAGMALVVAYLLRAPISVDMGHMHTVHFHQVSSLRKRAFAKQRTTSRPVLID